MKIGYFADGEWSHKALNLILQEPSFEIQFIVARYDSPDPVLKKYTEDLGIEFLTDENVNLPIFIKLITEYQPDLLVSMSFNQILKSKLINLAPKGFINCHAGALPFYRGRNILNWVLINGESEFGVTVHYIDEGIDTGDIILQKKSAIDEQDDYRSLLKKATILCAELLFESITLIASDKVERISQQTIHPVGFYCGRRKSGDEWLDWEWNSLRIHNFVRGITAPGPGARTIKNGEVWVILKTKMIENAPNYIGTPGEVVGKNNKGFCVKTQDTSILVTQLAKISETGKIEPIHCSCPIGTRFTKHEN